MSNADPTGTNWSDREIDLVIGDYFDMLRMELLGRSYNKAERNRALQELTHRTRGSIEYKLQNISAVLLKLGMPWIAGYKPMANYQKALIDGIERYLDARPEAGTFSNEPDRQPFALANESPLFLEAPPLLERAVASEPDSLQRLVRKFDPAARDARNRALGKQGEERVLLSEQIRLSEAGRVDLARKVRWTSEEEGDGAGYDILSFSRSGAERLLEVKTTSGHSTTPFYLTENERALSVERPDGFRLVRVYDFVRIPKAFELVPPLEQSVMLHPINYRASFS
jgi:hypothetical protein